jgi:hypothetical protein
MDKPVLLLEFDSMKISKQNRLQRLSDRIEVLKKSKSWQLARLKRRSKVR